MEDIYIILNEKHDELYIASIEARHVARIAAKAEKAKAAKAAKVAKTKAVIKKLEVNAIAFAIGFFSIVGFTGTAAFLWVQLMIYKGILY